MKELLKSIYISDTSTLNVLLDIYYNLSGSIRHKYPHLFYVEDIIPIFLNDKDNRLYLSDVIKRDDIRTPYFEHKKDIYIHPSIFSFAMWWIELYIHTPKLKSLSDI